MIKIILFVIAALVIGVLAFAATKPDTFRVERKAVIQAPPEKVFALLNDFKQWSSWSPWEKKDPAMQRTFGAVSAGPGATYAWSGNKDVGQGSMTLTESVPPSRLVLKLDFIAPFEAHNTVTFTLSSQGGATTLTWGMEGPTPYFAKIIHVFINMDRMVGGDFEAGLARLKVLAEQ